MSVEVVALVIAVLELMIVGPFVWWLASRNRKEDDMKDTIREIKQSIRGVHERINSVEDKCATKEYVDKQANHLREIVSVQLDAIMENLEYIRGRLDDRNGNSE